MSTSEKNKLSFKKLLKNRCAKSVMIYICVTIFCVIFGTVYTSFGHGVTSKYMTFLFVPSLVGGIVVYLILTILKVDLNKYNLSAVLYNLSIATVSTGFALKGVFEIADTDSNYMIVFWAVSAMLFVGAICSIIVKRIKKPAVSSL